MRVSPGERASAFAAPDRLVEESGPAPVMGKPVARLCQERARVELLAKPLDEVRLSPRGRTLMLRKAEVTGPHVSPTLHTANGVVTDHRDEPHLLDRFSRLYGRGACSPSARRARERAPKD
jgi:hypothetical protein